MYKHTKFFVKRQAESGIFYPICIIGPPLRPRRHPFAGNSPRRAVPAAGCPPLRPSRPAPDGVPSDQTAFPSLTSGPPLSQRVPLSFRPSDLPSHNDRAISHPDERLLSLTNIHPGGGKHAGQKGRSKTKSRGGKYRNGKVSERKLPGRKVPEWKVPEWKVPEWKVPERGKGIKRRRPYRDAAFHIPGAGCYHITPIL